MTIHPSSFPVLALPDFDPGRRTRFAMLEGANIEAIVAQALPGAMEAELRHVRVSLVTDRGMTVIGRENWRRVKPKPGVRVIVRVVPSGQLARTLLSIVVSIAAVALGQYWALGLGFTAGTTGFAIASGLIGIGVSIVGNLIINALIPPPKPKNREERPSFELTGWQNRYEPNGFVPEVLGTVRYAPPFAATPYTEIVGDDQYIRAVFDFGCGPVDISGLRLGDTSIDEYDEVDIEIREGYEDDEPFTLYPRQVIEEKVGAELTRPWPRDDLGNIIGGEAIETPVMRTTGADAWGASLIISWPAGMCGFNRDGKIQTGGVDIRIRHRLAGTTSFEEVTVLQPRAAKTEGFFRQFSWQFPTRGKYDVEVTMLTQEVTPGERAQRRTAWASLQTIRPEYPFVDLKPRARVAMRVKATHQLNGNLDNFNALASRLGLDWNAATSTWIFRPTSNPASIFRLALQSVANPKAVSNSGIDLDNLSDWHEFCFAKNLRYDRVLEGGSKLREVLAEIAGAGRAAHRHDGVKYGVVIDRPQVMDVVGHITARDSWGYQEQINYITPPHGFRVPFLDASNDYKPAERLIPWPGHTGPIELTEQLDLPGKVWPDEIWIETRRRMHEATHRTAVYTCLQAGLVRNTTRGDMVVINNDVLDKAQASARVKSVSGKLVEIDNGFNMEAGVSYAIRFRIYADAEDTVGTSIVRAVKTVAGLRYSLLIDGGQPERPRVGDIVVFGKATNESRPLIITRVETGTKFSVVNRMVDAAPIIDELTDAEEPPFWNGRIGEEIGDGGAAPPTPRFTSVETGLAGAGAAGAIAVQLQPGSGPGVAAIFRLQHRLPGAGSWTDKNFPASDGGARITGYATGNVVEMLAIAYSAGGAASAPTTIVTVTVGAADAGIPGALDNSDVTVGALLGGAVVQFQTSADVNTTQVRIWHSASAVLDPDSDRIVATLSVSRSRSYSQADGDTTRANLITGAMSLGAGWTAAGGTATHAPGTASSLSKALTLAAGSFYRIGFELSDTSAGSLTPQLTGGTTVAGTGRVADGLYSDRLQAVAGNAAFELLASSAADLSVSGIFAFLETVTSLAAGTHYYFLEPLNADDVPGPLSGPHAVTIR